MAPVYSEHHYIAVGGTYTPGTPPTAGNLLVIIAPTRAGSDKLTSITGWTIVEAALDSSGTPDAGISMFYRIAEAGDTSWTLLTAQCELHYSEWNGYGTLLDSTSGEVDPDPSPYTFDCGGSVTPATSDPVLIIGGISLYLQNDTETMSVSPGTSVTELDDWATVNSVNGSPGRWVGYREVASPSGSYVIGGTATLNALTFPYVGITAAFGSSPATPEPGVWIDFGEDGFGDNASDPTEALLPREMPQPTAVTASDNVTDYTERFDWNRGGSYDHVTSDGPGGATIILRNSDGRFDPDNSSSPYFGKMVPSIPVWIGAIEETGRLSGTGTVRGVFAGRVREWAPVVRSDGTRECEVICEDALGDYDRIPVSVSPSLTRSQGDLREAVLLAAGEASARLSLESEPGMLPISSVDSQDAKSVLDDLNAATASRHFIAPADTKEDWYSYTLVNKYHKLDAAVDETINGDDVEDISGWRVTNQNIVEVQRAQVEPITISSNNDPVWTYDGVPKTVSNNQHQVIWAAFDDFVFDASLSINTSTGSVASTLTNFGKTAKIELWTSTVGGAIVSKLQILGRRVVRGDTEQVTSGDDSPGARSGSLISNDFLGSPSLAQGICDFLIWKFSTPLKRPSLSITGKSTTTLATIFERDIYDVVELVVDRLSVTSRRLEIIGIKGSCVPGRIWSVNYELQETPNQSAVHYFTVGTDTVGSSVPIAPF